MTFAATTLDPRLIRESLHVSLDRMGRLLDVTPRTVQRSEAERRLPTSRTATERLALLRQVVELGLMVYTAEGFRTFLQTPQPEFANLTALQLIERGQGERVLAALAADYEGNPS